MAYIDSREQQAMYAIVSDWIDDHVVITERDGCYVARIELFLVHEASSTLHPIAAVLNLKGVVYQRESTFNNICIDWLYKSLDLAIQ